MSIRRKLESTVSLFESLCEILFEDKKLLIEAKERLFNTKINFMSFRFLKRYYFTASIKKSANKIVHMVKKLEEIFD